VIVDDSLGICADLDAAMARHVETYEDEWRGVLEDPKKLERYVSFVNDPATPDPTISFVTERGQQVPAPRPGDPEPVLIGVPAFGRQEVQR
jgi:nitrite reductase (NADH) large subunit